MCISFGLILTDSSFQIIFNMETPTAHTPATHTCLVILKAWQTSPEGNCPEKKEAWGNSKDLRYMIRAWKDRATGYKCTQWCWSQCVWLLCVVSNHLCTGCYDRSPDWDVSPQKCTKLSTGTDVTVKNSDSWNTVSATTMQGFVV